MDAADDQTGCADAAGCAVCGDPVDLPRPRPHEMGGEFGGGTVVRTYRQGDLAPLVIQLTRQGTFTITVRICPLIGQGYTCVFIDVRDIIADMTDATEECLDDHIVTTAEGSKDMVVRSNSTEQTLRLLLQLPSELSCDRYQLHFSYRRGQSPFCMLFLTTLSLGHTIDTGFSTNFKGFCGKHQLLIPMYRVSFGNCPKVFPNISY